MLSRCQLKTQLNYILNVMRDGSNLRYLTEHIFFTFPYVIHKSDFQIEAELEDSCSNKSLIHFFFQTHIKVLFIFELD